MCSDTVSFLGPLQVRGPGAVSNTETTEPLRTSKSQDKVCLMQKKKVPHLVAFLAILTHKKHADKVKICLFQAPYTFSTKHILKQQKKTLQPCSTLHH